MSDLVLVPGAIVENASAEADASARADVMRLLLADKRSPHTRRSYEKAWRDFFSGSERLSEEFTRDPANAARQFCAWSVPDIAIEMTLYKERMLGAGKTEATVNHHLSAVCSLLSFAFRLGLSQTDGRKLVAKERVRAYRDTRGIDLDAMKELLKLPRKRFPREADRLRRLRDEAILRLLCENGVRNDSLVRCDVGDLSAGERRLMILSKGHGLQKKPITLSGALRDGIDDYLRAAGHHGEAGAPLFRSLDHRRCEKTGGRLTNDGLRHIVSGYGDLMGIDLKPHKLRHSAITALLEAGYDVREVQKFSGHARIDTLLIYDDARRDEQGALTDALSGLLDGGKTRKRK